MELKLNTDRIIGVLGAFVAIVCIALFSFYRQQAMYSKSMSERYYTMYNVTTAEYLAKINEYKRSIRQAEEYRNEIEKYKAEIAALNKKLAAASVEQAGGTTGI